MREEGKLSPFLGAPRQKNKHVPSDISRTLALNSTTAPPSQY